ncbi:TetR/AcrR family transcriptional regulator [Streptomonospora sediminis]
MAAGRYHHGELRNALLDAAEELVRERGGAEWSLREASVRVGVSPSAAYHHFASRQALVAALAVRIVARLGQRMGEAAERATGPGAEAQAGLIAAGCAYAAWALEDPAVARLAFANPPRDPRVEISPHPHDVLDAQLDRLAATGALDPESRRGAEYAVWAAVHGLAGLLTDGLLVFDGPEAAGRYAERLVRAVVTGLLHEAPPPQGPDRSAARTAHTQRRARQHSAAAPATGNSTPDPS